MYICLVFLSLSVPVIERSADQLSLSHFGSKTLGKISHSVKTVNGGAWGSISRVFSRTKRRKTLDLSLYEGSILFVTRCASIMMSLTGWSVVQLLFNVRTYKSELIRQCVGRLTDPAVGRFSFKWKWRSVNQWHMKVAGDVTG